MYSQRTRVLLLLSLLISVNVISAQSANPFEGKQLYADVQKYVSFGEHRTGTDADTATSAWIKEELDKDGFTTSYTTFPIRQFFLEKAIVEINGTAIDAFPLWHVSNVNVEVKAPVVDSKANNSTLYKNNIVLTRFAPGGQTNPQIIQRLNNIINAGAKAVIAITENETGELVAYNALDNQPPWKIPVVLIAPKDSAKIIDAVTKTQAVTVKVKGTIKQIVARNVVGKTGTGKQHIVISTPISGWFTCGGERGPGIAVFLALAKWVSKQQLPYTFVFTANTGHELDNHGAHIFLNKYAPSPDSTRLWIHLGAAIATLGWKQGANGFGQTNTADDKRNIMYSENLEPVVNAAFKDEPGKRWKVQGNKALGELEVVAAHGYNYFIGIAQGFRYHHTRLDDDTTTSPEILENVTVAFEKVIQQVTQ